MNHLRKAHGEKKEKRKKQFQLIDKEHMQTEAEAVAMDTKLAIRQVFDGSTRQD